MLGGAVFPAPTSHAGRCVFVPVSPADRWTELSAVDKHLGMASSRTTFSLDHELAERARRLGINVSAAARKGVADAVRAALARSDREAYRRHPERSDSFWTQAETWSEE